MASSTSTPSTFIHNFLMSVHPTFSMYTQKLLDAGMTDKALLFLATSTHLIQHAGIIPYHADLIVARFPKKNVIHSASRKRTRESTESSSFSSSSTTTISSVGLVQHHRAPRAPLNLCKIKNDTLFHLMTFLEIDALKCVIFVSRSMRDTVRSYLAILRQKSIFHISTMEMIQRGDLLFHRDFPNLDSARAMLEILSTLPRYDSSKKVELELERGVYEVVGSCVVPTRRRCLSTYQKTLSVPCTNVSIVGKGEGETIVHGGFVVEKGRKLRIAGLTVKNASGYGVFASGAGTEIVLKKMTVEECQFNGVYVYEGAQLVATECHFHQNGEEGVVVSGSTTTARLTNCTSHHNKVDGVVAFSGAVVDLMGEGTSVHDNEGYGLSAWLRGSTINVYQPCVLNDMSHRNKRQNIYMNSGGIVQQKDSKK